jgi:hypothetical protein
MQTKITIESESCWLDRPEVTRLEVLRLIGYTPEGALTQILNERGKTYDYYPNISSNRSV